MPCNPNPNPPGGPQASGGLVEEEKVLLANPAAAGSGTETSLDQTLAQTQAASQNEAEEDVPRHEKDRRTLTRFSTKKEMQTREFNVKVVRSPEEEQARTAFRTNMVNTAKYTLLSFFPINLFEQIIKIANAYFILLSILQMVPAISITDGKPTLLLPLSVVLLASMVKDFVEDRKRRLSDTEENNSRVLKAQSNGTFESQKWADLRVGDIVKVVRDAPFPADLILLQSSSPKGICYVETKNLDGETNLKHKVARKEALLRLPDEASFFRLDASIICEIPNPILYTFEGVLKMGEELVPLGPEQLLLRGSTLKNTSYVYGVVTYTGAESKIQLNSGRTKSKRSLMETITHRQIIIIFLIQVVISLICAIGGLLWLIVNPESASVLELSDMRTEPVCDSSFIAISPFNEYDSPNVAWTMGEIFKDGCEDALWYVTLKLFSSWLLMTV